MSEVTGSWKRFFNMEYTKNSKKVVFENQCFLFLFQKNFFFFTYRVCGNSHGFGNFSSIFFLLKLLLQKANKQKRRRRYQLFEFSHNIQSFKVDKVVSHSLVILCWRGMFFVSYVCHDIFAKLRFFFQLFQIVFVFVLNLPNFVSLSPD